MKSEITTIQVRINTRERVNSLKRSMKVSSVDDVIRKLINTYHKKKRENN